MSNHFNKTISVKKGTALYVGAVLGSGILILPGMTASVAEGNAIASMGRLGYSLGQEEVAPRYLAHMNKKRETPTNAVKVVGCIAIIGLLISFIFHISIDKIVLIPNSLGIITYIIGTAAGIKLIKNKLGKVFSIVAFTCCLVVYPFIGGVILIPLAVSFICLCYLRFSSRR